MNLYGPIIPENTAQSNENSVHMSDLELARLIVDDVARATGIRVSLASALMRLRMFKRLDPALRFLAKT